MSEDGTDQHKGEHDQNDRDGEDEQRRAEAVEAEALQLFGDGIEKVAERDAGCEGHEHAGKQVEEQGDGDDRQRPGRRIGHARAALDDSDARGRWRRLRYWPMCLIHGPR